MICRAFKSESRNFLKINYKLKDTCYTELTYLLKILASWFSKYFYSNLEKLVSKKIISDKRLSKIIIKTVVQCEKNAYSKEK